MASSSPRPRPVRRSGRTDRRDDGEGSSASDRLGVAGGRKAAPLVRWSAGAVPGLDRPESLDASAPARGTRRRRPPDRPGAGLPELDGIPPRRAHCHRQFAEGGEPIRNQVNAAATPNLAPGLGRDRGFRLGPGTARGRLGVGDRDPDLLIRRCRDRVPGPGPDATAPRRHPPRFRGSARTYPTGGVPAYR